MTAKLELYRVFREVAETGNISAAAQNLYISQSAVSQSVKQLEGALQTRLFIRSPRGVTLTDDGQMLFEHVRSAMGLLETGEEKLAQTRALQMGKLVIGASDTVTSQFLLPHLDSFHKKYPNIHIQIISGRSHKVLGLLRSGKVDVAFASSPSEDEGLSCVPCFATHSCFVAAADYPCDFERAYSMQELAALPLILLERKASSRVSGKILPRARRFPFAGDRAGRKEPARGPRPHRLRRGGRDAGVRDRGAGERRDPRAENRL